jgi:hypothetical protein
MLDVRLITEEKRGDRYLICLQVSPMPLDMPLTKGTTQPDGEEESRKGINSVDPFLLTEYLGTAATELFCRGGKFESRLLKICQSHATCLEWQNVTWQNSNNLL